MTLLDLLLALEARCVAGPWRHDGEMYLLPPPGVILGRRIKRALKHHAATLLPMLPTLRQSGMQALVENR